jgi:demethylmenaquinone methyltransferase/2-methoxy-6-polyprenyl-1,4-benzoquinol methylase
MTTEPMFSSIAPRYDFCNHLFSFGLDFYWRKKTASLCCNQPIETALDMCCGTGDMAFALADTGRVKTITACDVSLPMLDCAKRKYEKRRVAATERSEVDGSLSFPRRRESSNGKMDSLPASTNRVAPTSAACGCFPSVSIDWLHCPAENTGLADASFDLITCAFGLRNVDDVPQTLKEMHRLLKPGGTACILEFFLPQNKILRSVYLFYLCRLMPLLARAIAGSPDPWHYLARSIEQWEKINLPEQLRDAGFRDITIHPLTFSSVRITTAWKE